METITKETHIIYMTYDTTTGEYYIGLRSWRGDTEPPGYFGSYKKDSDWRPDKKNLVRITLAEYPDRETLKDEEVEWIRPHLGKPLCKNLHNNRLHFDNWGKASNFLGKNHTEESREKMSKSQKGIVPWNKGKTLTQETRAKISLGHKGIPLSAETREKLRQANLGKKVSEETLSKRLGKSLEQSKIIDCPNCGKSIISRGIGIHRKSCDLKITHS